MGGGGGEGGDPHLEQGKGRRMRAFWDSRPEAFSIQGFAFEGELSSHTPFKFCEVLWFGTCDSGISLGSYLDLAVFYLCNLGQ